MTLIGTFFLRSIKHRCRHLSLGCVVTALVCAAAGCGGSGSASGVTGAAQASTGPAVGQGGYVDVSGKVSIKGADGKLQNVDMGELRFVPDASLNSNFAKTVTVKLLDGAYYMKQDKKAVPGRYYVTIVGNRRLPDKEPHPDYLGCVMEKSEPIVDTKYGDATIPAFAPIDLVAGTNPAANFVLDEIRPDDLKKQNLKLKRIDEERKEHKEARRKKRESERLPSN